MPFIETAGVHVEVDCAVPWVQELISEGAAGELRPEAPERASVLVRVEEDRGPFDTRGWQPLTRGAWSRDGEVVIEDACTAGFDLRVACASDGATFTYRWRPSARDRVASRVLRSRFHLLARAVLVQYPALWWAGVLGRAPLHASACTAGATTPLVSASGGIGRSTLVLREIDRGGRATGDNLAVSDGTTVWGLVEPLRIEGGEGRRMPHGRREAPMPARAASLTPDALVVLERSSAPRPSVIPCSEEAGARSLVTSTYMAGELRRYWAFAATLSAGTDAGPAQPRIEDVAREIAARLPCFRLILGEGPGAGLADLLSTVPMEVEA
jgi:hypothetical protein